jgi:hypothetical protein
MDHDVSCWRISPTACTLHAYDADSMRSRASRHGSPPGRAQLHKTRSPGASRTARRTRVHRLASDMLGIVLISVESCTLYIRLCLRSMKSRLIQFSPSYRNVRKMSVCTCICEHLYCYCIINPLFISSHLHNFFQTKHLQFKFSFSPSFHPSHPLSQHAA